MAHQALVAAVLFWIAKRRGIGKGTPSLGARRRPTPRTILIVLLVWVALAGAFAFLKFGPLATRPFVARDWAALALACGVIATLIVLLVRVSREARRTATKDGGDSTGSK